MNVPRSRIVVAGEEPSLLCSLDSLLGTEGHEVFITDLDGIQSEIADVDPQLVICDLASSSKFNIRKWRVASSFVTAPQVIVISSVCEANRYLRIMSQGTFRVLIKPFTVSELFAAVERALIFQNVLQDGKLPTRRVHRVLVVNDEPAMVDVIVTSLPFATDLVMHELPHADPSQITRSLGLDLEYEFHQAYDGDEAIKLLPSLNPDLIITNRRMPEVDGMEVLRAAKQYDPGIQVIIETPSPTQPTLDLALSLGAWDYVLLPFRIAPFAVTVAHALKYASTVGGRSAYHFLQPSELDRARQVPQATQSENVGWTPLHSAVLWSRKDLLKLLLAEGLSPNARDEQGRTPLHWAVKTGQLEFMEMLILNNAEIEVRDNRQKTPLDLANKEGGESLLKLLCSQDEREGC